MSYGGDGYFVDADEEEQDEYYEELPQQRQRNAPKTPGLRAHLKSISAENKALKKQLDEQKAMLAELMEADGPQLSNGAYPNSRLTPEEQMQIAHLQSMGAMGAAPSGSVADQIQRINAAKSPQELEEYLRSQGNTNGTQSYQGQGY